MSRPLIDNIFAMVPVEVLADRRLTFQQMRVLIALLSFRAKNTDVVWPGRDLLAARCGMHTSNISKATSDLVQLGWLEKDGNGGRSQSCAYRIIVPDLTAPETDKVVDSTRVSGQAVVDSTTSETVVDSTTQSPETVVDSTTETVVDSTRGKEQTTEQTIKSNRQCAREESAAKTPGKVTAQNENAGTLLAEFGIPSALGQSWVRIRNKKKLAITREVMRGVEREAGKLRITLIQAITICCGKSWAGFMAKWQEAQEAAAEIRRAEIPDVSNQGSQKPSAGMDWRSSQAGVIERGRQLGIEAQPGESDAAFRKRVEAADWESKQQGRQTGLQEIRQAIRPIR